MTTENTQQAATDAPSSTALEQAPPPTRGLPAAKANIRLGLAPETFDEGYRMAQLLAASSLVPSNFQGKPADVLVAIEMGIELGLPPMQALQSIAVINGRPTVWGDGFLALIVGCSAYRDHDEYYEVDGQRRDGLTVEDLKNDTATAVCTFWRANKERPVTSRFTIGQAKKAGLLSKKGPWEQYPDRMLKMRARGFAGRDAFPDVLRGIATSEEVHDMPAALEPAIEIKPIEPQRLSERTAAPEKAITHIIEPTPQGVKVAPVAEPPASDSALRQILKARVADVLPEPEQKRALLVLDTGESIILENSQDAVDLLTFKGTDQRINLAVTGHAERGGVKLAMFENAD